MAITIQSSRDLQDGSKVVYFTIEYDGKNYKWHGNVPKDADAQEFFDNKSDILKAQILRIQYPEADVPKFSSNSDGESALESYEAWIKAGCKNAEVKGVDNEGNEIVIKAEEVIEKKAWVDSEPPVDTAALIAELQEKVKALES
jgi:hypothetical protein